MKYTRKVQIIQKTINTVYNIANKIQMNQQIEFDLEREQPNETNEKYKMLQKEEGAY